jgi:hypothetical protein
VIDLSIPDDLKAFAEAEAARAGHSTINDYVMALLREAERRSALAQIEAKLIHSLDGPAREVTAQDWDAMDRRFEARQAAGRRP